VSAPVATVTPVVGLDEHPHPRGDSRSRRDDGAPDPVDIE